MILLCVVTYNLALYVILTSTDFWSWDKFFVYFSRQHHFYKWNMQLSCFAYSINKLAWSIAPLFSLFILIPFLNAAKIEDVSDIAEFGVCNNFCKYKWHKYIDNVWTNIFVYRWIGIGNISDCILYIVLQDYLPSKQSFKITILYSWLKE